MQAKPKRDAALAVGIMISGIRLQKALAVV
jgi:hypothetical protein